MSSRIPTPHINAPEGAFTDTVLMPGDPYRVIQDIIRGNVFL